MCEHICGEQNRGPRRQQGATKGASLPPKCHCFANFASQPAPGMQRTTYACPICAAPTQRRGSGRLLTSATGHPNVVSCNAGCRQRRCHVLAAAGPPQCRKALGFRQRRPFAGVRRQRHRRLNLPKADPTRHLRSVPTGKRLKRLHQLQLPFREMGLQASWCRKRGVQEQVWEGLILKRLQAET